jgi:hypothetical protein
MARATTVRFSDEVYARLDQASSRTGLPVNSIVVAACLEWMGKHTPPPSSNLPRPPRWSTIRRAAELAAGNRPAPGMYPFGAFSQSAQRLLTRSQSEVESGGFNYVGTEHMLLAAFGDPESQATKILTALGVTESKVRPALHKLLSSKRKTGESSSVLPTSRVKRVIELAFNTCNAAGETSVTTGHIVFALAAEGEGIAAHLLKDFGAGRDKVAAALEHAEPEP